MKLAAYYGELVVLIPDDGTIRTEPDREMSDRAFYCDAYIIEHRELDADPDGYCPGCLSRSEALAGIRAEHERRDALDLQIVDLDTETLEERLAPYGTAYQQEVRERELGY